MKTIVYVDGFNLYYGAIKGTPYKWLNLEALFTTILPRNEIIGIKYYTAIVSARPDDPQKPVRQQTYLRALKTLPKVQVTLGHFLQSEPWMPTYPRAIAPKRQQYVQVIKTEEKGSDVNLAVDMVYDACIGAYEVAVVVSNDSDLERAIRLVRQPPLNKKAGIINPHTKPAQALLKAAHFYKPLRSRVLAAHQFPPTLTDGNGEFHKPKGW